MTRTAARVASRRAGAVTVTLLRLAAPDMSRRPSAFTPLLRGRAAPASSCRSCSFAVLYTLDGTVQRHAYIAYFL